MKTPEGLDKRGRQLWLAVMADLELEPHETLLLEEACRVADRLEQLHLAIRATGMTMPDGRVNPALIEVRLQGVTLARLVASLRLPDEYRAEMLDRGQRRGALRGTYRLRAVNNA